MATVIRYIVGIVLVVGLLAICVMSVLSIVAKVREFIRNRKKSPDEGKNADDVNASTEETGKEVDKQ